MVRDVDIIAKAIEQASDAYGEVLEVVRVDAAAIDVQCVCGSLTSMFRVIGEAMEGEPYRVVGTSDGNEKLAWSIHPNGG